MRMSESQQRADFAERLKEQVVGQLFFQDVTEVDQFKSTFEGVRSLLLCLFIVKLHIQVLPFKEL